MRDLKRVFEVYVISPGPNNDGAKSNAYSRSSIFILNPSSLKTRRKEKQRLRAHPIDGLRET